MRATGAWDPATPPRRPRKRSWTPSPRRCAGWSPGSPRHALRHAAQPWPATEPRPPRQRPGPTPGSPAPQAPESPTIFFGTPTAEERRRLDAWYAMQDDTLLLADDSDEAPDSPGMARAATPLGERAERRAALREALGDISNVSPASRGSSPAEKPVITGPAKQDSVPSLLHEWAASKFDRPFSPSKTEAAPPAEPLSPGSSLVPRAPPQAPAAADVFSSPPKAPSAASPARTGEQKLARVLIETPRTAPAHAPTSASRMPAMRVPSPQKLSAQAARGADVSSEHAQTRLFRTSPFTGARRMPQPSAMRIGRPSPGREPRTGAPSPAREPRIGGMPRSEPRPLAEAAAPSPAPGRSPSKAVRVQRPARFASSVPATRVWDKPAQPDPKRRRIEPAQEPVRFARRDAETPQDGAPGHRMRPTGTLAEGDAPLSNGRTALRRSTQAVGVGAAPGAARPAARAAPAPVTAPPSASPVATAPEPTECTDPPGVAQPSPAPAPAPTPRTPRTSSRTNLAARTPWTPRQPATPMSATELTLLTSKHTRQNQAYNVQIQTRVQRIAGQRPPSPEPHFSQGSGATGELVRFSGDPERDLDAAGRPTRHARGAGDREEWVSPPHTRRGVRWDKRLVVSPRETRAERGAARSCLVNGYVQLDAHGNEVLGSAERMPRTRVLVRRRVYDDDDDQV